MHVSALLIALYLFSYLELALSAALPGRDEANAADAAEALVLLSHRPIKHPPPPSSSSLLPRGQVVKLGSVIEGLVKRGYNDCRHSIVIGSSTQAVDQYAVVAIRCPSEKRSGPLPQNPRKVQGVCVPLTGLISYSPEEDSPECEACFGELFNIKWPTSDRNYIGDLNDEDTKRVWTQVTEHLPEYVKWRKG